MPIMVEQNKWILYKHTCNFELIKAVAVSVKNACKASITMQERQRLQERLTYLNLYKARNPSHKPLDAINHRINTLEFYMFGYESGDKNDKRFIFSPLGNLFLNHIHDNDKLTKIFTTMLFAIQFQHPANNTPAMFNLYPFRLIFQLLQDDRLNHRLYHDEYAYFLPFIQEINPVSYEDLVAKIQAFRKISNSEKISKFKANEHTFVNCVYEWQYYTVSLLEQCGILTVVEGTPLIKLFHPRKTNSTSAPTGRTLTTGYVELSEQVYQFVTKLLAAYPYWATPLKLNDTERMHFDIIKEIYNFYPQILLTEINEKNNSLQVKLLELPKLIEEYASNPNNETAYKFEDVLTDGFNMFYNVEAKKIGGAGHTDIECLYLTKKKKFAVEAKSTANKLSGINAGRLAEHRKQIGGEYTVVVTPRYVPATKIDIQNTNTVIVLASTFSEYLYNHIYHDVRTIDYADFDDIIVNNMGTDISKLISNKTMEKFAIDTAA